LYVLRGEDAWAAQQAIWKLAAGGAAAVSFLDQRLHVAPVPGPLEVDAIRSRLTDPDYGVREIDARRLLDDGIALRPAERELLRRPAPPLKYASAIPFKMRPPPKPAPPRLLPPPVLLPLPERLQATRTLAVLEHSTDPAAAMGLLVRLTDGAPDAAFTRSVKTTLARMRKH